MRKFLSSLALVALLVIAVVPSFAQDEEATIADIVASSASAEEAEFSVLLAAVQAADPAYLELLSDDEASLTVFAPTDAAFGALLESLDLSAEDLLGDTDLLNEVLAYHVVPGVFDAEAVIALDGAYLGTALPGAALAVSIDMDNVYVNDSMVVSADVMASNGVVHVIDSVLLPTATEEVVAGERMEMEDTGTLADIVTASTQGEMPEFTTLLAAVQAADPIILSILSGPGPYTVFAPTDAAFAAALEALGLTAEELLTDTELLTSVLAYHVLPGQFDTFDLFMLIDDEVDLPNFATMLAGTTIQLTDDGINDVNVIDFDIYANNGVIHVIDGVILPATE